MGRHNSPRRDDDRRKHVSRSRSRSRSALPPSSSSRAGRRRSRSRSRSPMTRRHRRSSSRSRSCESNPYDGKRKRGRSPSRSRSTVSSHSDQRHAKYKHKKSKHHKKRSSRSCERRERKKEKKERKKKQGLSRTAEWGKYGIITEVDMFTKGPEFHTWLVEERKINPETMSKEQNKKEFARFMEDFNTATLPHEKYYNMEAYQQRMDRMRSGEFLPPPQDSYDLAADLRAHQNKLKKRPVEHESYLSKEQLLELRKVQNERVEAAKMKLLGMDVRTNMGVRMDGTMFEG